MVMNVPYRSVVQDVSSTYLIISDQVLKRKRKRKKKKSSFETDKAIFGGHGLGLYRHHRIFIQQGVIFTSSLCVIVMWQEAHSTSLQSLRSIDVGC